MDKTAQNAKAGKPVIGITVGDLNGIGTEIIIKALSDNRLLKMFTPVVYGSTKVLSYYRKTLGLEPFNHHPVNNNFDLHTKKINVKNCWQDTVELNPGQVTSAGGKYAFIALEAATNDLREGKINALVTAPINKKNIQSDDFKFVGHTEYLTHKFNNQNQDSLMLLVSEQLRIGVVTSHIPLVEVKKRLTQEAIVSKINLLYKSLKNDFGIIKPKIAVLGLNPHAGEDGLLGNEETEIIIPAINECKKKGNLILGPFPADGFFGKMEHKKFDGVMAMYHDQGLIPFKTLAFDEGVNYTAGLPVVRTSPDHGTAYNLAGKNKANEESMLQAIFLAMDITKKRMEAKTE
ncbi:4-hydroxythreonine-4-phosphate dehydrogenase PdxA [Fulvivirgaceae bacterium BMA12]|uniref:4-hydroxythreonine-4-phosphate dehydrogenase PdxA n=1 Tax=Agaribacillus aureus TaxID=3051825 RepID=A0ABT8LGE8_9BACT|nr:4-hydroxythreonine-4-phosphate dehydrogenase PdxA [Fulvivirgaceae bacterium BMA12]